jgi:hypothetical protein
VSARGYHAVRPGSRWTGKPARAVVDSVRALRTFGLIVVVASTLGAAALTYKDAGIEGTVFHPDCVDPVLTTPCQIRWLPLAAQIRIFARIERSDGTDYPGASVATDASSADGHFKTTLGPGKYFVQAYAVRNDRNWWASEPLEATVHPFAFVDVRIEVRAYPAAICLASDDYIATPSGPVAVTRIRPGMTVWTVDAGGRRVAAPVKSVSHTPAPPGHLMLRLVLADGRVLEASAGHPTTDGRHVGDLQPGDALDGSRLISLDELPYVGETWDLLPAGLTGAYWANGVLLASTLKP